MGISFITENKYLQVLINVNYLMLFQVVLPVDFDTPMLLNVTIVKKFVQY